jgi:predicted RNase H-like HicB family nuclease
MKVTVIIERGENGRFSAYVDEWEKVSFGLLGEGDSVQETMEDFSCGRDEMREVYEEEGRVFPDMEFVFKYDVASFLNYYSKRLSLAGLERLTGIRQGQLSHYASGRRRPSTRTAKKIEDALHAFAEEIRQVEFV